MLTKEEIQSQDSSTNLGFVPLAIPFLSEPLRIKRLTLGEKEAWRAKMVNEDGELDRERMKTIYAALVAMCVVDESGAPLFIESEVLALSPVLGEALIVETKRINGIGKNAVETEEKN